jgi:hypothetical protein
MPGTEMCSLQRDRVSISRTEVQWCGQRRSDKVKTQYPLVLSDETPLDPGRIQSAIPIPVLQPIGPISPIWYYTTLFKALSKLNFVGYSSIHPLVVVVVVEHGENEQRHHLHRYTLFFFGFEFSKGLSRFPSQTNRHLPCGARCTLGWT